MTSKVFPREEYEARWAKVQSELARRDYETAVIWSRGASARRFSGCTSASLPGRRRCGRS